MHWWLTKFVYFECTGLVVYYKECSDVFDLLAFYQLDEALTYSIQIQNKIIDIALSIWYTFKGIKKEASLVDEKNDKCV